MKMLKLTTNKNEIITKLIADDPINARVMV